MNYYIETYQDGKQLLGSDFTKTVRNCKSERKLKNAIETHKQTIESLKAIKPFLNKGYELKTVSF